MASNKHKYWLFYLVDKDAEFDDLYAFTDNPELAENFIETRSCKKFYLRIEKFDTSEINQFLRTRLPLELSMFSGNMRIRSNDVKNFSVAMTDREISDIRMHFSSFLYEKLLSIELNDTRCLKKKYIKALQNLLFPPAFETIEDAEDAVQRVVSTEIDNFKYIYDAYGDLFSIGDDD